MVSTWYKFIERCRRETAGTRFRLLGRSLCSRVFTITSFGMVLPPPICSVRAWENNIEII